MVLELLDTEGVCLSPQKESAAES